LQLIRIGKWAALGPPAWTLLPPSGGVLGRAHDCDLRLKDPAVSLRHAEVGLDSGALYVQDLGSRHGLAVDGRITNRASLKPTTNVSIVSYNFKCAVIDLGLANEDELEGLLMRLHGRGRQESGLALAGAWAEASPKSSGALRMLAWFLLAEGRLGEAARAVEKASWRAPEHPATRLAAALLAERQGRLGEAQTMLEDLIMSGAKLPQVGSSLSRVLRKEEVYAKLGGLIRRRHGAAPSAPLNQAKLNVGTFSFIYTAGLHDQLVQVAYAALAQAAEQINQRLHFDPGPVEVHIKDELEAGGRIEAAALYREVIELHARRLAEGDPNFLYVALAHEYVHLMVDRLCNGACPRWLDEGLAQYLTQNPSPKDRRALDEARQKGALMPLEALTGDFSILEHPALVNLAYAQSYSLAEFLAERCGGDDISHILAPFDITRAGKAAPELCGIPLDELETHWLRWLQ
jgi:tetratricopeptide (TPR) repeat protein